VTSPPSPRGVVLVVDDDASVRDALRSLIGSVGLCCETFASARELLASALPEAPTCLVLDVHLADANGLDVPAVLARAAIDIPIVFITGHGTIPMSVQAMKAGAVEFLTKPFSEDELLGAIDTALRRDDVARARQREQRALRERFDKLTPREREVFSLVAAGRMNKEIAARLGTAEQTVKQHRGRVMEKLDVRTVADLVRLAERLDRSG
jgi:RNA polymerase sigma factor (sigma-70 family)